MTNARAYNQSLRKRGMISLYVPDGDLKAQFINAKIRTAGVSGREPTYTSAYIELIYTFYRLFGWGMRQITGYMEDYWATRGLDIAVPSSGQLCDRFAALEVSVTQRCGQLARRLARGEAVSMIGQHGAEFWARQPVVRGKIRAEGHAHTMAKDAPGDRC